MVKSKTFNNSALLVLGVVVAAFGFGLVFPSLTGFTVNINAPANVAQALATEKTYYAAFVSSSSFGNKVSNAVLKAWYPDAIHYASLYRNLNSALVCPGYETSYSGDFYVFSDLGSKCKFTGRSSYGDAITEEFTSWLLTDGGYRELTDTSTGVYKPGNAFMIEIDADKGADGTGPANFVVFAEIKRSNSQDDYEWRWIGKCEITSTTGPVCALRIGPNDSRWGVGSIIVGRTIRTERPSVRIKAIKIKT